AREASIDDLVTVIESVARGEAICSPRVAAGLLRRVAALAAGHGGDLPRAQLTNREREIVRLIDNGLSNKEIARALGIEVATVKNHVHNILEKLQVHRRGEAAARVRGTSRGRMSGQVGWRRFGARKESAVPKAKRRAAQRKPKPSGYGWVPDLPDQRDILYGA